MVYSAFNIIMQISMCNNVASGHSGGKIGPVKECKFHAWKSEGHWVLEATELKPYLCKSAVFTWIYKVNQKLQNKNCSPSNATKRLWVEHLTLKLYSLPLPRHSNCYKDNIQGGNQTIAPEAPADAATGWEGAHNFRMQRAIVETSIIPVQIWT